MTDPMAHESDPLDQSDLIEQALKDSRITAIRKQAKKLDISNPGGFCWYCEEETGLEKRFCNIECRDGWSKEND